MTTTESLADSLTRILDLKGQKKAIEDELEMLEGRLKAYLGEHPESNVIDYERGISATLISRSKGAEFDLISMSQRPEEHRLLVEAAREGLLTVRTTAVRAQKGHSEAADVLLAKYEMPAGSTTILAIERGMR